VVSAGASYITSVSSPLAVATGNLTVDLSAYLTSATAASTYQTLAGMSSYLTTATAASTYYLQTNPSGFQTAGDVTTALSPYLLSATAASTYAVIAAGQPTAGSTGQVLTKQSGANWDSIWTTITPGDRYLTSSTTSNTVSNGNKTFTIGTGLSYTPTQNITISYDASNHMHGEVLTYNSGTGVLTVDINNHTGSGTYTSWVVNVGGVTPATSVAWGAITGTLSSQTDLQSALDLKLFASTASFTYAALTGATFTGSVSLSSLGVTFFDATTQTTAGLSPATAASTYQTISGMSTYAPLASPALTGNVTITTNSASPALVITQDGAGDIIQFKDVTSDTTYSFIDANGKVSTIASTTANAGFNIAHGAAPTSPANGDIWTTTTGLFMRQNGTTKQYVDFDTSQTINGNKTFSNANQTLGNSTATGTISVASGATISASTKTVNVATGGVVGSTTNTTIGPVLGASTTSIGGTTAASTLNLATGATLTATTKAVNIGTSGVAGSTTNITIGSTTGTSTTTLQGITNGITEAVDTNNTELATTAFVVGQASSTTPLADGTAAVGTSLRYARADHVHPSSGGGGADIQTFTTAGTATWTKPAGKTMAWIRMWGGGGGGGNGGRAAVASARAGGNGGHGGNFFESFVPIGSLGATETVTVGAGGTGAAARTTDGAATAGGAGGMSTFSFYKASGGLSTSSTMGVATFSNGMFSAANSLNVGGAVSTTVGNIGGIAQAYQHNLTTGGGGGGGAAATIIATVSGGAGGPKQASTTNISGLIAIIAGGAAGNPAIPSSAATGVSGVANYVGGTGAGGGGYKTATVGQSGADGAQPGGGGGGGGGADTGFNSGAGGNGGVGMVIVVCY
jgi:hypothetical protein